MVKKITDKKVTKKVVSKMDIARKAIQKKYGDVVKPMSEKPLVIDTVSTRSIGLDAAIGRGGFALGRIYEIYGPNSGGKTTLAVSVIAEAQSRNMKAVFIDAEHSADPTLFESMGVDLEKLDVIDLYTGEENLDAAEILMRTGEVDVVVVDSVTALIPKVQAEKEIGDHNVAVLARLMSSTLQRFSPLAARHKVLIIFINQIRQKIGVTFGNPETTPAGEALPFYATGRLRVNNVGAKSNRITDESGKVIGHKTKISVIKNKLACPFTEAVIDLYYGKGYSVFNEVITLAVDLGIIEKAGSWYKYEGKNIGQGATGIAAFFEDFPDIFLYKYFFRTKNKNLYIHFRSSQKNQKTIFYQILDTMQFDK